MSWTKVTVTVPDVNQAYKSGNYDFSAPAVKNANVNMMKKILSSYSGSITKYGQALDIPDGVIISFIASESGGTPVQITNPSGAAKYDVWGIMAISPAAFYDAVTKWGNHVKTEPIPDVIKQKINEKIPGLLKTPSSFPKDQIRNILKSDQDFNTMAGCMVLRWLFERFSVLGVTLFNKAIVSYNAGLYQSFLVQNKTTPNLTPVDTAVLIKDTKVPLESRSYLLKVLGKDGFMDLYYGQNLVNPSKDNALVPATNPAAGTAAGTIVGSIMASVARSISQ